MTPDEVARRFTRSDGSFLFARWGRPIVPVVFGVEDRTLAIVKGAVEAVVTLADHRMAGTDPELGANQMWFFVRAWDDLREVPGLDRLIPDLGPLLDRLQAAGANQYRVFRFDPSGAIRASVILLRMDDHLASVAAEDLALAEAAQAMLLWSDTAFRDAAPLVRAEGGPALLAPGPAAIIRAAYDPVLPAMSDDPALAHRIAARLPRGDA